MAVRVVEALEVVDVEHDHGGALAITLPACEFLLEELVEEPRIPEAGQRIGHRQAFHRLHKTGICDREGDLLGDASGNLDRFRVERIRLRPLQVDHADDAAQCGHRQADHRPGFDRMCRATHGHIVRKVRRDVSRGPADARAAVDPIHRRGLARRGTAIAPAGGDDEAVG
jgi:hypothetical protein